MERQQQSRELREKVAEARTALEDVERTLRGMIERICLSNPPDDVRPEEWTLDAWWNSRRIPRTVRTDCEYFKQRHEQSGVAVGHPWEYASLFHLYRIVDENQYTFKRSLFDRKKEEIYKLLLHLVGLTQLRNRFAHPGKTPITFPEVKEVFDKIHELLNFIPQEYHHPPYLVASINESLQSILDQEDATDQKPQSWIEERFTDGRWNYAGNRLIQKMSQEKLTVEIAFRAGMEHDGRMLILLESATNSLEEYNRVNHAFMAGRTQSEFIIDLDRDSDSFEYYQGVVTDLIWGNIERAKTYHQRAKKSCGRKYEDHLIATIEAFLEDENNVREQFQCYARFLRYIKEL